jgi:hypothetical protein
MSQIGMASVGFIHLMNSFSFSTIIGQRFVDMLRTATLSFISV